MQTDEGLSTNPTSLATTGGAGMLNPSSDNKVAHLEKPVNNMASRNRQKQNPEQFHDCGNLNAPLAGTQFWVFRSLSFDGEPVNAIERRTLSFVV